MPEGVPRYIRVYDNGGGAPFFCKKCLLFSDDDPADGKCECGNMFLPVAQATGSFDRYTVVFAGNFPGRDCRCHYVGMSTHPYHPQGFGQHEDSPKIIDANKSGFTPAVGGLAPFRARRITWAQLPPDCQKVVRNTYINFWGLEGL